MSVVDTRSSERMGSMRGAWGDSMCSMRRRVSSIVACMAARLRRRHSTSVWAKVEVDIVDDEDLVVRLVGVEDDEVAIDSVVLPERKRGCCHLACSCASRVALLMLLVHLSTMLST